MIRLSCWKPCRDCHVERADESGSRFLRSMVIDLRPSPTQPALCRCCEAQPVALSALPRNTLGMPYAHDDLILYVAAIERLRDSGHYGCGETFDRWLESPEGVESVRRIVDREPVSLEPPP